MVAAAVAPAAATTAAAAVAPDMNAARTGSNSRNISGLARLHMRNAGAYMAVRSTSAEEAGVKRLGWPLRLWFVDEDGCWSVVVVMSV